MSSTLRRPAAAVTALSLSAFLALGTAPARAEVTFEAVEQALAALESAATTSPGDARSGGSDSSGSGVPSLPPVETPSSTPDQASGSGATAQAVTPPQGIETTLPPSDAVPSDAVDRASPEAPEGFEFAPLATDATCSGNIAEVTDEAKRFSALSDQIEETVVELGGDFAELEAESARLRTQDVVACPPRFQGKIEDLLTDLNELEITPHAQAAEALSVCAQKGRQGVERRIETLSASSDIKDVQMSLAMGQVLAPWSIADVEISEAVSHFISLNRRRLALIQETERFLTQCTLLKEIYQ